MNKKIIILGIVLLLLSSFLLFSNPVFAEESNEVVDLDIDSDNNNEYASPDRSTYEDEIEAEPPGKYISINDNFIPLILEIGSDLVLETVAYRFDFDSTYCKIWRTPQQSTVSDEIFAYTSYVHTIWILGDMNGDGMFNGFDIDPFMIALNNQSHFENMYPNVTADSVGDINGDGIFNDDDIGPFNDYLGSSEIRYVSPYFWIEGVQESSEVVTIYAMVDFDEDLITDKYDSVQITVIDEPTESQLIIEAPTSVEEGEIVEVRVSTEEGSVKNVAVTFAGDTILTNNLGIATFTAPYVDSDQEHIITVSKDGYLSASATITVENIPDSMQLKISNPSSVKEDEEFDIYVTVNGALISGVSVQFSDTTKITNDNGICTFIAPPVTEDTSFLITASKEGYQSASATATVTDKKGWIFGVVNGIDGNPIENAIICVTISTTDDHSNSDCTPFTDSDGQYDKEISTGSYAVTASKQGYETSVEDNVLVKALKTTWRLECKSELLPCRLP